MLTQMNARTHTEVNVLELIIVHDFQRRQGFPCMFLYTSSLWTKC